MLWLSVPRDWWGYQTLLIAAPLSISLANGIVIARNSGGKATIKHTGWYCCRVKITLFVRTYGCPPLTKMKTHCLSKKINVNSSQIFIIYVNIISLLHYEWLYHQIHLIYTLIGVCPTLTKILFKTSLSWKRKCIIDIIHHLVTHTPLWPANINFLAQNCSI